MRARQVWRIPGLSCVDRLALTEQERVHLPGGLFGREPLQGLGAGRRRVLDYDPATLGPRPHLDRQRSALPLGGLADREGQLVTARVSDPADLQAAIVEHERARIGRGENVERRRAADRLRSEVEREIEIDMGHPRDLGLGICRAVMRIGGGEDGRDHLAARALLGHRGAGSGGRQQKCGGKYAHGRLRFEWCERGKPFSATPPRAAGSSRWRRCCRRS